MLAQIPSIVIEDAALTSTTAKRRRVEPCTPDNLVDGSFAILSEESQATCPSTSSSQATWDDSTVCFGMVVDRPVIALSQPTLAPSYTQEAVFFTPDRELRRCVNTNLVGHLDDFAGDVLSRLTKDDELHLQLSVSTSPMTDELSTKPPKGTVGFLGIIIYGPKRRSGDVGYLMSECNYYLEDPTGCDRNVPYLNPQCLFSLHEHPPMTFDLPQLQHHTVADFTRTASDILAGFETTDSLAETATPGALRTALKAHQRQALTFFLRREYGLHPSEDKFGIWSQQPNAEGNTVFVNTITNQTQSTPPPVWRGGLLADEMGLGKTLSIIALIASDLDRYNALPGLCSSHTDELHSTLIIVPLNVLAVWEFQLKSHVYPGELTWFSHHGRSRLRLSYGTRPPDIVFTTYQTIEREKRNAKPLQGSVFSYQWKRIVLDEAHIIRNHKTATARAVASLKANSRWAMSGTPIQNSLTDFLGLFKFLHFKPYDDARAFDDDISGLWRSKPHDEATETFRSLLSCIMIRRTKAILELPNRVDKVITVTFDRRERDFYDRIERPLAEMLDEVDGEQNRPSGSWLSAIQQINKLRLVCNLGTFVPSQQPRLIQPGSDDSLAVLGACLSMGGAVCAQCLNSIGSSPSGDELEGTAASEVYYSECHRLFCAACSILLRYQSPEPCDCTNRSSPCLLRPLQSYPATPRLTPTREASPSGIEIDGVDAISSKVRTLITQIIAEPGAKHVVFSSWTSSLDMVQRALQFESIQFVRIDGKVKIKKREEAIQQFHKDPDTSVILITISCGACGLDLTAASRVHMLEPQWNPSLEDQALARAHRLGQTHPVTTLRYVMRDSFEEHILKVQDRKKLLARTLLSNDSSLDTLRKLLPRK